MHICIRQRHSYLNYNTVVRVTEPQDSPNNINKDMRQLVWDLEVRIRSEIRDPKRNNPNIKLDFFFICENNFA